MDALPRLPRLTAIALTARDGFDFNAVAQQRQLQRLSLWVLGDAPLPDPAVLRGPWLASLRWLALPWTVLERAAGALQAASRLEHVCLFRLFEITDEMHAAWHFLATHPSLRCFDMIYGHPPSTPVYALLDDLRSRRPTLQVRCSAPQQPGGFHAELLHMCDAFPPLF